MHSRISHCVNDVGMTLASSKVVVLVNLISLYGGRQPYQKILEIFTFEAVLHLQKNAKCVVCTTKSYGSSWVRLDTEFTNYFRCIYFDKVMNWKNTLCQLKSFLICNANYVFNQLSTINSLNFQEFKRIILLCIFSILAWVLT